MSVKQAVRVKKRKWAADKKKIARNKFIDHLICGVLGFFFSLSSFSNSFSPFAVAFASSVSGSFSLSAAAGAVAGWFLTLESVSSLRYMAAVMAACVIKNALKAFPKIYESRGEAIGISFGCIFITGFATIFAEGITLYSVLFSFAESIVAGASAFLFYKVKNGKAVKGGISALNSGEIICICVCVMLLLLGIKAISVFDVYPARILCGLLVLLCAFYSHEAGGSISGVCGGIAMSLGGETPYLLGIYSFGGLVAGVFSQFGKIASVAAYSLSGTLILALGAGSLNIGVIIIETVITGVLFFAVTYFWGEYIQRLLKPTAAEPVTDGVRSEIFRRLKNASEISTEICTSLTDVNQALLKSEKSEIKNISRKTKERICGSCGLYDVCWGESLSETQDCFNTLLNLKKEGVYLEYKTVPVHFAARCIRTENIAGSFNRLYSEYVIRKKTESRLREMHNLASEQFINVSSLLDSLCEKLTAEVSYDTLLSSRIISASHSCGFRAADCICAVSSYGKMRIELKLKNGNLKGDLRALSERIEVLSMRKFELPIIEKKEAFTLLIFKEKAELKVVSTSAQYSADGEKFSGDSFATFEDDNGMFYAVICDGMGTGAKAALSSSLAIMLLEKLIKAGFGINAAVNTVNTSLISKSGDECSVTLDLAVIDLFTGFTQFYKCGAAETVLRKNGKIINVNIPSLPLGIISNTEIGCSTGVLRKGDAIIMVSDGVLEADKALLRKELKVFSSGKVKNFTADNAEKIRKLQKGKKDDMTILTIAIEEND